MYETAVAICREAESAVNISGMLNELRRLPFDDFGELTLQLPLPEFPRISMMLPAMAPADAQIEWTGGEGRGLLQTSIAFMRSVELAHLRLNKRSIAGLPLLDFGCGWGRLLRLALYFSNPADLYGCDPAERSIAMCTEYRVLGSIARSERVPHVLPFQRKFSLVYAFSVFTHLSARAAEACLRAIGNSLTPNGTLVLTVRPMEFWDIAAPEKAQELKAQHDAQGFAFLGPEGKWDDNATYGDASVAPSFFDRLGWSVLYVDRNLVDPHQIILFLQRAV